MNPGPRRESLPRTLCEDFLRTVAVRPDQPALRWRHAGSWREVTWADYRADVAVAAADLDRIDVRPGERVALMMQNRYEFHVYDLAALFLGATTFSIYHSSSPEQIRYMLGHSGASTVIVQDGDFARRVDAGLAESAAAPPRLVLAEPAASPAFNRDGPGVDLGAKARELSEDTIAAIIYTSGTTGPPKAVQLSHRNIRAAVGMWRSLIPVDLAGIRQISYLPTAHIAERICTHYMHMTAGTVVSLCPEVNSIAEYMLDVRPQWWFCTPRLWDKLRSAIEAWFAATDESLEEILALGGAIRASRGSEGAAADPEQERRWGQVRLRAIKPALASVGLDEVLIAFTGGAPFPPATHEFFLHLGLPLTDCYGQSETVGLISWDPTDIVIGCVGKAFPGVGIRIAEDGELEVTGPQVFPGYLDAPRENAEAFTADGWLRTGDLARVDQAGNLWITGRKKDLLITSGGKNVSPALIEAAVKECPLVSQICVVGDARPFISAVILLDLEAVRTWAKVGDHSIDTGSPAADPAVLAEIEAAVAAANMRFSRAEQIKEYVVVDDEWAVDSDVLTPTMKVKRRGVAQRYTAEIEAMYSRVKVMM